MTYIRNPGTPFVWESDGEYEKHVSGPPAQATVSAAPSQKEVEIEMGQPYCEKHSPRGITCDCDMAKCTDCGFKHTFTGNCAFASSTATKPTAPSEGTEKGTAPSKAHSPSAEMPTVPTNCKHCGYPMSQHTTNAGCNLAPTAPCPLVEKWRSSADQFLQDPTDIRSHAEGERLQLCADELEAWEASQKEKSCEK